jgi:hypothetical protein
MALKLFEVQLSEVYDLCKILNVSLIKEKGRPKKLYVDIREYYKSPHNRELLLYATPIGVCYTSDEFVSLIKPIIKHVHSSYESNGRIASIVAESELGFRLKEKSSEYEINVTNKEREIILDNLAYIQKLLLVNKLTPKMYFTAGMNNMPMDYQIVEGYDEVD